MNGTNHYASLPIWGGTIELVKAVNKITELIPRSELAGITNALKRTLVDLPIAIAKAFGTLENEARPAHIIKALDALDTIEVLLQVAVDLGYVDNSKREKVLENTAGLSLQIKQLNAEIEKKLKK